MTDKLMWMQVCHKVFNQLKTKLVENIVLYEPDYVKEFVTQRETKLYGGGIVLSLIQYYIMSE